MYRLQLSREKQKDLDRLRGHLWERVRDALIALRENPRPENCVKLRGGLDAYRIRVGDWRVLYEVDDGAKTVTIRRVRHRRDVYRNL